MNKKFYFVERAGELCAFGETAWQAICNAVGTVTARGFNLNDIRYSPCKIRIDDDFEAYDTAIVRSNDEYVGMLYKVNYSPRES
jgi:hypothetical protein